MDEFARSFNQADTVYLVDIYPASEKPIDGVASTVLAQRMRDYGHRDVKYVGSLEHAIESVVRDAQAGDAILTLGAGSVSQAGDQILERLSAKKEASGA
jgi:UDP-N-acetylmuramate--alanine ligase